MHNLLKKKGITKGVYVEASLNPSCSFAEASGAREKEGLLLIN
jgi:hypothetical protein